MLSRSCRVAFCRNIATGHNVSRKGSLSQQRPRGSVPSFPRRCGPARPHSMPGERPPTGVIGDRPILPAMRRLFVFLVAATLFASCGGQTAAGSDRPVRILSGKPDHARSGRPGRCGERRDHGPALRVADELRRRPPGPPGPRRIVAVQRRRAAGHVPSPPGPDVLGRQPVAAIRRRRAAGCA